MISSRQTVVAVTAAAVLAVTGLSGAYASTSTDVQANQPQIAAPQPDVTGVFPNNKQNEPAIAVSRDGMHLVAGTNDEQEQPDCGAGPRRGATADDNDCSFFPGVGTDGVYVSSNGGTSWTNLGLIDDQASWTASPYVSDGDPVLVFGPRPDGHGGFYADAAHQRVYYQSLASWKAGQSPYKGGAGAAETVVVSYSDNWGATWSKPVVAGPTANPITFNDKNALGVDDDVRSPNFGRLYSSWTAFRSNTVTGNGNAPVKTATSGNGGASFGAPTQLSPATNNAQTLGRQGSAVTTTPDGTAMVAFEQGSKQVVSISRDAGRKWSGLVSIGSVADIPDPIPGANFRTDSFLSLAGDPSVAGGGSAYATWVTRTASGADLVLYRTTNRGLTWSKVRTVYSGSSTTAHGYPFFQGMDVAPNGRIDIGWQALRADDPAVFGTGNAAIDSWAASSPTWSVSKVSTASSDPAASAQNNLQRQFWGDYSTLVSTNAHAWFIYTDSRNGVGCPDVDAYQTFLIASGAVVEQEDRDAPGSGTDSGAEGDKPGPADDCPAGFGNTDAFVSVITP